ncbi:MAG: hypothetical protein RRY16_02005 [Bacilli bacterium]
MALFVVKLIAFLFAKNIGSFPSAHLDSLNPSYAPFSFANSSEAFIII